MSAFTEEQRAEIKEMIRELIKKPKQFSYRQMTAFKKQHVDLKNLRVKVAMLNSITVAYAASKGRLKDTTKGARFYLNPVAATDLSWSKQFVRTAVIGDHHFYYDPKQRRIST